jgi:hypothetical protein
LEYNGRLLYFTCARNPSLRSSLLGSQVFAEDVTTIPDNENPAIANSTLMTAKLISLLGRLTSIFGWMPEKERDLTALLYWYAAYS